ncbi:hypothetical protein Dsin_018336 [Dipteronia sinensis]|uniref:NB-ARC domain-containing protein n=1 Tax=Dipteronia sinensis TaxID=43782 RepID=A0AAE0A5D2_9ROSI|nr:hypothetical protein Dsin_018336 [Dipteronia sinensis]
MEAVVAQATAQAAGSLVVPAVDSSKGIFSYLKRKYGYVRNMGKNFADLQREEKYLCDEEEDVKTRLDRNRLKMEKTRRCETWLNEVVKMKEEIKDLNAEYRNVRKFLCGLCPFPSLVKLGKRIVEKTAEVVSLKNQIGQITVMVEKAPAPVVKKYAKKIEEVPSLNKHVEMLQECLRNAALKRICIWGPPGVGKTTIMENLHDTVGDSHHFDIIFWVTLNTNGNVRDIQEVLVERLDLKAEEHSNDQRADMISEELKNKSYVLFLDGVSSEINLREVGIHEEHKHGKVVFACRYRNICGQTDEDINVRRLSNEDAQKLFWEIVGLHVKDNQDIKPVAKLIVKECGGMPYMIKLIGNSLENEENPAIWRDTLSQLRSPSMEPKQELEEVYNSFKLVCDKLDSYKLACLLYWAIFPSGYELHQDYIIECWRAEQFFPLLRKLGEARDRGHYILNEFVGKSLLEKGRKAAHYKMFEHFQRVALRIANQDENSCRILVKEGEKIREEEWEIANRISLIGLSLSTLPKRPKCCRILTLLLQESSLDEFPRSFFGYMCSLQLLDLHDTKIRLLPSSISSLINLKVLFLNNCNQLMQLPAEVGDLRSLEILDIRHTGIHSLPIEIGRLTDLKCLRVSFVENVVSHNHVGGPRDIIASNTIAKLVSLEELTVDVNPNNGRWNQTASSIAIEVASLEDLSTLCFYFPDVDCFQNFINTSKSWNGNNTLWGGNNFRAFSIVVGYHQRSSPLTEFDVSGCSAEKQLRFSAGEGFPDAILKVLEQAYAFELIGHRTATNLSDFGADKLGGLEACMVEECNEMTSIVDGNHTGGVAFQRLKKLHINNLPKLVHIWKGSIQSESFILLTTLTLKGCHSVKTLFSEEMVLLFNQLQYLQVEDCNEIEEIIKDGSVVESRAFPKLKDLQLCYLPKLSNIYHVSLEWPSLEMAIIKTCEELKNFPSTFQNATRLSVIRCSQAWWNRLIWPDDMVRDRFKDYHQLI